MPFNPPLPFTCDIGNMASPVSPASVISEFRADRFVDPGAHAAAGLFEGGAELTYHQGIRHKIESEHQNPAEDYLYIR